MAPKKETSDQHAARQIIAHALKSVLPGPALRRHLRYDDQAEILIVDGRGYSLADFQEVRLVGGGKAAWPMAAEIVGMIGPAKISGILNVYRDQAERPIPGKIKLFPADHPVPNEAGGAGAREMIDLLIGAGPRTLVLALISGGGSSLMALPVEGIPLEDYREAGRLLLTVPAAIDEVNCVRKHIDRLKGGRMRAFARNAGAFISIVVSDVPVTSSGAPDDPSVIASGPTVGDATTFAAAKRVLEKFGIWARTPETIRSYFEANIGIGTNETLPPDSVLLDAEHSQYVMIANNDQATAAAAEKAEELGFCARRIGEPGSSDWRIRDEVESEIEKIFAVVTPHCRPRDRVTFASFATDGIDGNSNLAGAVVDGETWRKALGRGLDPERFLARYDSAALFEQLGLGIETGPTGTNVADLCLVQIRNSERKLAFIFGGEATVRIALNGGGKPGRGGRNTHLALLAAKRLRRI